MPHELSAGQQQRVGLARAMVINPTVLPMDEPLSNPDAKLRVGLHADLRRIQQDLEGVLALSQPVCVLYGGIIRQVARARGDARHPRLGGEVQVLTRNNGVAGLKNTLFVGIMGTLGAA